MNIDAGHMGPVIGSSLLTSKRASLAPGRRCQEEGMGCVVGVFPFGGSQNVKTVIERSGSASKKEEKEVEMEADSGRSKYLRKEGMVWGKGAVWNKGPEAPTRLYIAAYYR